MQASVLKLCVMIGSAYDALQFLRELPKAAPPAVRIGTGKNSGPGDHELKSYGIASVPHYPHLVVVSARNGNQVRVYDIGQSSDTKESAESAYPMLCKLGRNELGATGQGLGEFSCPWGVAVTADSSHVVVTDKDNQRAQLLTLTCTADSRSAKLAFVRLIGEGKLNDPEGLTLRTVGDRQTVLITEYGDDRISEWGLDGTHVRSITASSSGADEHDLRRLGGPISVTVLPTSGIIAVALAGSDKIAMFEGESGRFLRAFGEHGDEDGQFKSPEAVASDAHDHVLVLDHTERLQVFDAEGTHLYTRKDLGIHGSNEGLEWHSEEGRLAIANGMGYDARLFTQSQLYQQ